MLAKFHLPTQLDEKPGHYLPLFPALRFVTDSGLSQGLADFGFLASQRLGFEALSERFQATVYHSPTLLSALRSWCKFVQMEDNVLNLGLKAHHGKLRICYTNTFRNATEMPHLEHAQWIQNMMTIHIVRQFAGHDWTPSTFAFQSRYMPTNETQSLWPNTRFLSGQAATWVDVPVSLLPLPVQGKNPLVCSTQRLRPIDVDIVNTLKLLVSAYLDTHIPNINETADIVGTSVRSLQRKLSAADMTYSDLLDQVRFEKATELLRNTDAKIIDVAFAAGYQNPSHFARAFHRIAGVAPNVFRKNSGTS